MTDFGKRFGDMFKSTYDTDDSGVVDEVETYPAHKTDHQDGGADEIDASGLVGRADYVDRGDPASYDWTVGSFTTNGAYHDLDCSSIVPAGAKAIVFRVYLSDETEDVFFQMRKNGNSNGINNSKLFVQTANRTATCDMIVACDSNRVVEYLASNTTITTLSVVIAGWFV